MYSPTQGQNCGAGGCVTAVPIAGGGTSCGATGGNGGNNGQAGKAGAGSGAGGGLGRPAINDSGIEIAVAGDIDGGVV